MDAYQVYTGHWINYSLDGVGRSQWTLTAREGGYVLAAVAAFITVVGAQFWTIASFIVHQYRASAGAHDGLHHVQQVVYRNSGPLGAAWTLFTAGVVYSGRYSWHWPERVVEPYADRRKSRGYLAVVFPLAIWGAFVIAATFSSLITGQTSDANEVKVHTNHCGFIKIIDADSDAEQQMYRRRTARDAQAALSYVNACYNNTVSTNDGLACKTLPQSQLNYEIVQTTACPFGNRCKVSPIVMDTSWMDSHFDFGINAPAEDRVQLRKQATCAIVDVSDLTDQTTAYNGSTALYEYYLGSLVVDNEILSNRTFWTMSRSIHDNIGYTVSSQYYTQAAANNTWLPIPDFNVSDGDTSVFALSFGAMSYMVPVDDPLYAAHNQSDGLYYPDSDAGVMACVDRVQIQTPDQQVQSVLGGLWQVISDPNLNDLSTVQYATAYRLLSPMVQGEMYSAVDGLGVASLRAQRSVIDTISTGIPDNQWQQEVYGWFETTLSLIQHAVVSFASKTMDDIDSSVGLVLNDLGDQYQDAFLNMCMNQKIRNVAQYQSFSVDGVTTILGIGAVIILISLSIDSVSGWIPKMKRRSDRWRTDSVLHLQRLAYQNAGQGAWERTRETVPAVRGHLDRPDRDSEETSYISVRGSMSKLSEPQSSPMSPQPPMYMPFHSMEER